MISGEEVLELVPALAAREPTSGYLFYDCQTDDARLVLTVLGEAERFGAVCANGVEVTELVPRRPAARRACGCASTDGERVRRAGRERRQRDRRVGRPPAPRASCTTRPRCRASGPAAARTSRCATRTCRSTAARSCPPAAGARSSPCRGSGARWSARPTTTSRGDLGPRPAGRAGHRLPARRGQRVLRHDAQRRRHHRRLRRRAPADLDRRPAQVRRHLAQGRAVRDLERDGHDHRRQADDVAADGEDGRRPARRARGARRALPHARDPARRARRHRRAAARGGRAGGGATRRSPAATGTPPTTCWRSPRERRELAQPIVADLPDLLAEVVYAARREQARTLGDVLLRRTRLGLLAGRELAADGEAASASARRWRPSWAGTSASSRRQLEAWRAEATAEGVVGSA